MTTQHMLETGHTADFDKTKILDVENKQNRRLTIESLRIKEKPNKTMNAKEDIDKISAKYDILIKSTTRI